MSAASEREATKVNVSGLQYTKIGGEWFARPSGSSWRVPQDYDKSLMLDRIVELEERVKHLACPRCLTVNPPEVHTCTPRPKVTTVKRWDVIDERLHSVYGKFKSREDAQFYADGTDFRVVQMAYVDVTAATTHDAPHTVKRVALLDEPTTRGEGCSDA